jgi:hypothetical protein
MARRRKLGRLRRDALEIELFWMTFGSDFGTTTVAGGGPQRDV